MNNKIIRLVLLALVIRLVIAPFTYHPWEYRTYNNTCANIHDGINPYSYFWELTEEAKSRDEYDLEYYEYWAYSPAGLAWLAILSPLDPEPIDPFAEIEDQTPDPLLSFLFKLPSIIADLICGYLLYRLAVRIKHNNPYQVLKWWLLMPLPWFLTAVWGGFDSVVLAGILAAILLIMRPGLSGLALGFGAAVKTLPVFIGPVFLIHTKRRKWVKLVGAAAAVMLAACFYYLIVSPGDLWGAMVGFHGGRYGGGLTIYSVWQLGRQNVVWDIVFKSIWVIPLVIGWLWIWRRHSGEIIKGCALTLLWFVIASKLVNPAYMLYVFPFMLLFSRKMPSFWQLMLWQGVILTWIFFNLSISLFFMYPLYEWFDYHVIRFPDAIAYMAYLGFGWLIWVLNINIFRDWIKK